MKWLGGIVLLIALGCGSALARDLVSSVTELERMPQLPGSLPIPADSEQLFYIQRSTNANTIIYAATHESSGDLDRQQPVKVYWRRYAEDGRERALYFFERVLAFGVSATPIAGTKRRFNAYIFGYPTRSFIVQRDKAGRPEAVTNLGGHQVRLMAVYIQLDGDGFIPTLVSADIYGADESSGQIIQEHLAPRKD